jgi:hypothetical protein
VVAGIGRRADVHDLSRLFARLEALVLEEEMAKARGDLPDVRYHEGLATIPPLSPDRRDRKLRPRTDKSVRPRPGENVPAGPGNPVPSGRAEVSGEEEPSPETGPGPRPDKPLPETEPTSREQAATRPGDPTIEPLATMLQATPGFAAHVAAQAGRSGGYRRPAPSELALVRHTLEAPVTTFTPGQDEQEGGREQSVPAGYDEGIWLYLERWCEEFGDNDPARSLEVVHHLWWNAHLPRSAMHNALKAAYHSTRRLAGTGKLDAPMAYFLVALKSAVVDQRVRLGKDPSVPGSGSTVDAQAREAS